MRPSGWKADPFPPLWLRVLYMLLLVILLPFALLWAFVRDLWEWLREFDLWGCQRELSAFRELAGRFISKRAWVDWCWRRDGMNRMPVGQNTPPDPSTQP